MKVKLSSDDRCAIDLVLESRAEGNGAVDSCFGKSTAALQKRMRVVDQILGTLAHMPAGDPPTNLVAKTLKFIKKHQNDVANVPAAVRRPAATHGVNYRPLH
jgi:hypothetical protein